MSRRKRRLARIHRPTASGRYASMRWTNTDALPGTTQKVHVLATDPRKGTRLPGNTPLGNGNRRIKIDNSRAFMYDKRYR